jgi:hypothetical protein
MNNDILCRWRDASTDPPPERWAGFVKRKHRDQTYYSVCTKYDPESMMFEIQGESNVFYPFQPGDQWLDITDIPGVAREADADDQLRSALGRIFDEEMGDSIDKPLACHDAINRITIRLRNIIYQHTGSLLPMDDLCEVRRPEPEAIEAARNDLISWMMDHGYHTEDAAADVDGLIGVCQRGTIPRARVQAAAKRIMDCQEMSHGNDEYVAFGTAIDVIEEYTGVTPTEEVL